VNYLPLPRPQSTFGGEDLYPGIFRKAAALMFSQIADRPFVDGTKRVGTASAEIKPLRTLPYEITAALRTHVLSERRTQ
jgi:prophage maintenance system killer protein